VRRPRPPFRAAAALALGLASAASPACRPPLRPPSAPQYALTSADDAFLEDLSRRSFRYFAEQADPGTGLVRDRARARADAAPAPGPNADVASIAATGFGLTGLCIAAQRGWMEASAARARALATLRVFAERAPHERGWFYHWMDARTGERRWQSEVSSIDTALLLAGVLSARQCFGEDAQIGRLAGFLYERVDFPWMLAGDPGLLSMGWKPETGFLASRWDGHYEQPLLVLLGIGSPTRALAPASWLAWPRAWVEYAGYRYVAGASPLFVHQYSQAWVDFRGRRDRGPPHVDYFANSVAATRAHRLFCIGLARRFPRYSEDLWGITASDSARGYVAWGGPPAHPAIDGSIVPCAAAGSLMFAPDIALPALRRMRERFGNETYHRYGFADAFNPATGWIGPDVIGIDVGITLLSAENLRSESVWRWFMANAEIPRAMDRAGLVRYRASPGTAAVRGRRRLDAQRPAGNT
jgi:hypothetical protein